MMKPCPARPLPRGFTLIELVIVVAVIAVLASIAYPSYQSYLARGRRADAQQFMLQMQNRQQQILIEQRAYATAPNALNVASTGFSCTSSACTNAFYTITFNPAVDNTATPPSYTVCAIPIVGTPQTADGTLMLTHAGAKTRIQGLACGTGTDLGW